MLFIVIAALLGLNFAAGVENKFDAFTPSIKEFTKAISNHPDSEWGKQARGQNSIRILTVGGSNTAGFYLNKGIGFVSLLDKFLKNNLANYANSWVINVGESGRGPSYFIGKSS
jgi:hypothetical protein